MPASLPGVIFTSSSNRGSFYYRELKVLHDRNGHGPFDDLVDWQGLLGTQHVTATCLSGRMAGREERAAILIGDDGYRIRAEHLGLGGDFFLVHANQRTQYGLGCHLVDRRHVLERLRRDLTNDLARDEHARPCAAAERLGDPHHETPVDDDAQRRRDCKHDTLLDLAERDEEQARSILILGEDLNELTRLFLRCSRQDGIAVKVNEDHPAAPAHHAPCGDGRIDPAREQTGDAATRSDWQPAGAAFLSE